MDRSLLFLGFIILLGIGSLSGQEIPGSRITWSSALQYNSEIDWISTDPAIVQALALNLGAAAVIDSRSQIVWRGKMTYDPTTGTSRASLADAYGDFMAGDFLFFRLGKQYVQWGWGRYFRPSDVINLTQIDPSNPMLTPEGPMAVKVDWKEAGGTVIQTVISADQVQKTSDFGFSFMGSVPVGPGEVSLGGYYQPTQIRSPRLFFNSAFFFSGWNVYTESVMLARDDQPSGTRDVQIDYLSFAPRFQNTAGFSCDWIDPEGWAGLEANAQYYFNGASTSGTTVSNNSSLASTSGKQYIAAMFGLKNILNSATSFYQSGRIALEGMSWTGTPRLEWVADPDLIFGAQTTWTGGPRNGEYSANGASSVWQIDALLGGKLQVRVSAPYDLSDKAAHPRLEVNLTGLGF